MAEKIEVQGQKRTRKRKHFPDTLRAFIASIPARHIAHVGRLLGMLAHGLDRRHRRIVKRNLQFTHPEWSQDSIQRIAKRVFQNMGINVLEICQMMCFSRQDILRRVRIRGKENLLNAVKSPRGVITISAHLGNWEMSQLLVSCYLRKPVVVVARRIQSKMLDRWIHGLRVRFGSVVLDKKRALPKMARALHQGKVLGLLIDQGTKLSRGVEVSFFGRTTTATPAAAILARRYDSPVLPAFCVREADASLALVVEPPLNLQKTEDPRADLKANTQLMTSAIEKAVRAYPEQWFWFHKRWKRHYPHLYPEDLARRQRRREKKRA